MSLILCKSYFGSNYYISFNVFYHCFCAQMTARAVIISRVTASGNGVINFAQVTAGLGVFLRSFYQL